MSESNLLAERVMQVAAVLPQVSLLLEKLRGEIAALTAEIRDHKMTAAPLVPVSIGGRSTPWSEERLHLLAAQYCVMQPAALLAALNALPGSTLTRKAVGMRAFVMRRGSSHSPKRGGWTPERDAALRARAGSGISHDAMVAELNALPGSPITDVSMQKRQTQIGVRLRRPVKSAPAPIEPAPAALPQLSAVAPAALSADKWTPAREAALRAAAGSGVSITQITDALNALPGYPLTEPGVSGRLYKFGLRLGTKSVATAKLPEPAPAPAPPREEAPPPPKKLFVEDSEIRVWAKQHGLQPAAVNEHRRRAGLPIFVLGERVSSAVAREWGLRSGLGADAPLFAINAARLTAGRPVFICGENR
jgi:hypothetical protein